MTKLCALLEQERPAEANGALRAQGAGAYTELISFVADRPGHDRRYALDTGKIARELGWRPRHGLDEALRETVRWYLANGAWCRAVGHVRRRLGLGD